MSSNSDKPKHPPQFCPACASPELNYVICTNTSGDLIYDTYCKTCEWSGDVSPDKDLRYIIHDCSISLLKEE